MIMVSEVFDGFRVQRLETMRYLNFATVTCLMKSAYNCINTHCNDTRLYVYLSHTRSTLESWSESLGMHSDRDQAILSQLRQFEFIDNRIHINY